MAISKVTKISAIRIVGDFKHVEVKHTTDIIDTGVLIASTSGTFTLSPGDDYLSQPQEVQDVCNLVHTPAVIAAYQEFLSAQ